MPVWETAWGPPTSIKLFGMRELHFLEEESTETFFVLRDDDGEPLVTITADEVGNHDTVGGACSQESNTLRYGHHTKAEHACVENFLEANLMEGRGKRDMVSNINWFMNVPVEADGTLGIVDGLSAPGKSVRLRAEIDTLVLVSNCPQINNPCNGFDPTPVRMVISR